MNPLIKLAASAIPGEQKYVLFAGAGLSKDAGLPTAWDLMLATAALLRSGEDGDGDGGDLETWFKKSAYANLPYAQLIGQLFPTPIEQRSFLREKLRAEKPASAHLLIAELAKLGVIRCIVTTNFDNLIEQAVENVGLPVQIISNENDLIHSEPLIHCKYFRVYKPHGTLGVGYIRNTPSDLAQLPQEIEDELVHLLSDHGLMVLGYSGFDEGILKIFERRRQNRYPAFWINPVEPPDRIPHLFGSDTFNFIKCDGASKFLKDLLSMYKRLSEMTPTAGFPSEIIEVRDAIIENRPNVNAKIRAFMDSFAEELSKLSPDFSSGGEPDELLFQSIQQSEQLIVDFTGIVKSIAETGSGESALTLYKSLGKVLEGYGLPKTFSGSFRTTQFDFHKFIGHEIFVSFIGCLIHEERWEIIAEILNEDIYVDNADRKGGIVPFTYASDYVALLDKRNQRLGLKRVSLHADILQNRHSSGELSKVMPFQNFMDADFFLFIRGENETNKTGWLQWRAWSTIYMNRRPPKYLVEATRLKYAKRLFSPFGVANVTEFRTCLREFSPMLRELFRNTFYTHPLFDFNIDSIGSKE